MMSCCMSAVAKVLIKVLIKNVKQVNLNFMLFAFDITGFYDKAYIDNQQTVFPVD